MVISRNTLSELAFAIDNANEFCMLSVTRENYGLSYTLYSSDNKSKTLYNFNKAIKRKLSHSLLIDDFGHTPFSEPLLCPVFNTPTLQFIAYFVLATKKQFQETVMKDLSNELDHTFKDLNESESSELNEILSDYNFYDFESDFKVPELEAILETKRNSFSSKETKVSSFYDVKVGKDRLFEIVAELSKKVAPRKSPNGFKVSVSKSTYNPDYARNYYATHKFEQSVYAYQYGHTPCEYNGMTLNRNKLARLFKAQGEEHPYVKAREFVV